MPLTLWLAKLTDKGAQPTGLVGLVANWATVKFELKVNYTTALLQLVEPFCVDHAVGVEGISSLPPQLSQMDW